MPVAIKDLINKSVVQEAADRHAAARARHADAVKAVGDAETAHKEASQTLDAVIRGTASGSTAKMTPVAAQRAVRDAEDNIELTRRLMDATQQACEEARLAHVASEGESYREVMRHGARQRVAACAAADLALQNLAQAHRDLEDATKIVREAINHGVALPFPGGDLVLARPTRVDEIPAPAQTLIRTERAEAALWGNLV